MEFKRKCFIIGIVVTSLMTGFSMFIIAWDGFVHGYAGLAPLNIPEAAGLWGLVAFVVVVIAVTIELLRSR